MKRKMGGKQGVSARDGNHAAPDARDANFARVPVAAIGASAGGLEALNQLFGAMPPDSGMAFVVVQHLDPSHESRMAEILRKHTTMPVDEAQDGMEIQPNHVYTNPAERHVALEGDRIRLSEPVLHGGVRRPIDYLLTSLAEALGDQAVCILLSGSSGSDGLRGVRAVRAAGGICMVQDPQSAQFPEMPQGIIGAGLADHILPAERMPQALLAYVRSSSIQEEAGEDEAPAETADILESILKLLRVRASSDYQQYRKTTVLRRIRRRMGLRQADGMAAYLKLLEDEPDELAQLAKDMLIGVSAFFRDADAFEDLGRLAILPLVKERNADAPLRAWVPGCATGEEAYSVAMLLFDAAAAAGKNCPVQVFASDVDEEALETARAGIYPAGIAEDVSPERLERFFIKSDEKWQVSKRLREAVVFSRHNLLSDPPFSKLDLISCRNVLIYLEPAAQRNILTLFSFALNPGGFLFLGKSEGAGSVDDGLFESVSKQRRLLRLVQAPRRAAREFPLISGRPLALPGRERPQPTTASLVEANQEALLRHFNASMVLIDPKGRILYFHGQTERYLRHGKGPASLNLLDLTDGLLSAKLRRAIEKALEEGKAVALPRVPMPRAEGRLANLTVLPVQAPALGGKALAVIFEDAAPAPHADSAPAVLADERLVEQLEAEVKTLREELRANDEEYGSVGEELKAANEEMMSMNEELQSANEELEASREELQSLNEELTTLNSQLREKISELTAANDDLANLVNATQIATLFLDEQMRIKRFSPLAEGLLNVIPSDVGRPFRHITPNFPAEAFIADAERVLKDLATVEKEIRANDGRWFTVRILPYRTLDGRIEGVVITFSDVTRLKEIEGRLNYEKAYAQGIVETVRGPLVALDTNLRVLSANKAFYQTFRVSPEVTVGQEIYDLGNRQWDIPRLRELLGQVISKQTAFEDFEVEFQFPGIGRRTMLLNARRMEGAEGERILLAIEDVSERKRDRAQLRSLAAELARTEQRERARLAHVLHDELQQLLVAAQFHIGPARSSARDPAVSKALEEAESLIAEALNTSRSLTAELSPTILYEAGLHAALPWLARQMKIKHGLDVQTDIQAPVAQDAEGAALTLFDAVRELLFNVVKHAKVHEARVELEKIGGDEIRIVVSDKGAGFEPSQLKAAAGAEHAMGLFGIRERIEHLGGRMQIESAPGAGTRVTLTVPLPRSGEAVEEGARSPEAAGEAPPEASGQTKPKLRVLLVDDHAIVRQGIAGILQGTPDIEVVGEAGDGAQAVEKARELRPDVILMDFSMPVMDGVEATRAIHASQPDIRIIGLSMYQESDRAEAMRQAGATAYLSKGGPPEDLLAAVRACCPQRATET